MLEELYIHRLLYYVKFDVEPQRVNPSISRKYNNY